MKSKNKKILIILCIIIISFSLISIFVYRQLNAITLIQLSTTTNDRMMGYILVTNKGKVIVVDGGNYEDGKKLKSYINSYGGTVEAWFLTHYHHDHTGAINYILDETNVNINKIYSDLSDISDVEKYEKEREEKYKKLVLSLNGKVPEDRKERVSIGQVINIDNISIKILGTSNAEIEQNFGNNQSLVIKMTTSLNTTILFLGDTGIQSEEKLLLRYKDEVSNIDYIQMAHHGQNGVDENFYIIANPKNCLWPTPKWLYENDNGNGYDSGPWKTIETREWIKKIGSKNYIAKDGDILLKIY